MEELGVAGAGAGGSVSRGSRNSNGERERELSGKLTERRFIGEAGALQLKVYLGRGQP